MDNTNRSQEFLQIVESRPPYLVRISSLAVVFVIVFCVISLNVLEYSSKITKGVVQYPRNNRMQETLLTTTLKGEEALAYNIGDSVLLYLPRNNFKANGVINQIASADSANLFKFQIKIINGKNVLAYDLNDTLNVSFPSKTFFDVMFK